jgi:hypothetical protein
MTKAAFLTAAESIARADGTTVDRAASRSKECLVSWFCEFVPQVLGGDITTILVPPATPSAGASPRLGAANGDDGSTDNALFRDDDPDSSEAIFDGGRMRGRIDSGVPYERVKVGQRIHIFTLTRTSQR